jgi:hypothetical protein
MRRRCASPAPLFAVDPHVCSALPVAGQITERADAGWGMAGSASRKRSADHAPASFRADDELAVDLDNAVGADQRRLLISGVGHPGCTCKDAHARWPHALEA